MLANPDGHFVGFEELDAVDDLQAVQLAQRHSGSYPLELWCGRRKIKTFPARRVAAG
jgi:hypothetical protein